ncbi:hypothetical protein [Halarcobacter sp.]|uniref:hypothetical protein n=1 Tax=Halarcobacter sp. TaxID=2321133 RepID=UPI003A8C9905
MKNKVYHGPINIGGIGGYISKYLRSKEYISEFIVWQDNTMRYNHDYNLHIEKYGKYKQKLIIFLNFLLAISKYDVFHFYGGITLLPYGIDLPFLKLFRKKIIMTYCGSEARLVGYVESKRNPFSHLLKIDSNNPKYDDKKIKMIKWHSLWCDKILAPRNIYASALFAANEKKVLKYPWIHNLGFNTENLAREIKTNKVPTIVHAPSNRGIKGTEYIEKAIEKLKEKGLNFQYKRVEKIPNHIAQEIYKEADIIVDQLLIGGFGTLAVEGMGYGKPVVCYILDDVKKEHYPDCPIYNANIDTIEKRLEALIQDENLRLELGQKGVKFVKKYFDNKTILKEMEKIYEEL